MKIDITSLLAIASLATTAAAADRLIVKSTLVLIGGHNSRRGTWISDHGRYSINAKFGCQNDPGVPAMERLCLDNNHTPARGHFIFKGQNKRCLKETKADQEWCGANLCTTVIYDEVRCTW